MADYYTSFSCVLDVGSADNVKKARDLHSDTVDEVGDPIYSRFKVSTLAENPTKIWICSEDGGDPEQVVEFVLKCAEQFNLQGLWGFECAETCSEPRLDAFGGGAIVIDLGKRKIDSWLSTKEWLTVALEPVEE